jgi:hypothetical protein
MPCGCVRDIDESSPRFEYEKKTHGKTRSGVPITDESIEKLAAEAEAGDDVDEILRRRRGRPPIGSGDPQGAAPVPRPGSSLMAHTAR